PSSPRRRCHRPPCSWCTTASACRTSAPTGPPRAASETPPLLDIVEDAPALAPVGGAPSAPRRIGPRRRRRQARLGSADDAAATRGPGCAGSGFQSGEGLRPGVALRNQCVRIGEVLVELTLQLFHHGGLGGGQIVLLADVRLQVVQLAVLVLEEADQLEPAVAHRRRRAPSLIRIVRVVPEDRPP